MTEEQIQQLPIISQFEPNKLYSVYVWTHMDRGYGNYILQYVRYDRAIDHNVFEVLHKGGKWSSDQMDIRRGASTYLVSDNQAELEMAVL